MSTDVLAGRFQLLADREYAGYSPLYDRLARAVAGDEDVLVLLAPLAPPNQLPVRLFACVHDLVLAEPDSALALAYRDHSVDGRGPGSGGANAGDPWPAFRALLFERIDELGELMRTRSVQTNEVGRTAALVPALTAVSRRVGGRPLSLIELGPSAGLNLVADRYRVDYSDGRTAGPLDAGLTLRCRVVGPHLPPLPDGEEALDVVRRLGIDLAPIDVTDLRETRWLEACVWPDVPHRVERLRAAIEIARAQPPELWRGDVLDLLGTAVAAADPDSVVVVVSTWVLAYLSKEGRLAVHEQLRQLGADRDIALLTAEYPQVTPWIPPPDRAAAVEEGKGATLLGLALWLDGVETDLTLAWMHAHGTWLDWMDDHP